MVLVRPSTFISIEANGGRGDLESPSPKEAFQTKEEQVVPSHISLSTNILAIAHIKFKSLFGIKH